MPPRRKGLRFERLFDIIYPTAQIADRCTPPCIAPHRGRGAPCGYSASTRGLAIVGFGLIEAETGKTQMLQYGAVTTPAGLPLAARLVQLERDMEELIAQLRPEAIAVEELFFSNNITTGIAVAHARGIILCTAAKSGIPLFEYTPMQVKQAVVGYGLAEKRQVMDMVRRLLKLKAVPRPDDAADALALAARARTKSGQANRLRRTLHVLLS